MTKVFQTHTPVVYWAVWIDGFPAPAGLGHTKPIALRTAVMNWHRHVRWLARRTTDLLEGDAS